MLNKQFFLVIPLLAFFEAITYLATDMYLPGLPQMQQSMGLSLPEAQLTLTAWFMGSCSLQLILGPLTDTWGRRPILLAGGAIFIASTLACAFTNAYSLFLICRFLQGSTVCAVIVAGYATIHELFDHNTAIKALALMGALTVLAPALGPVAGGYVIELSNWRNIFIILGLGGLLCVPLLSKVIPETLTSPQQISLTQVFIRYFKMAKNPQFYLPTLITSFIFGGFIAWLSASPMLLINGFQLSPVQFGYCQLAVFGSYVLGTRLVKLFLKKTNSTHLTIIGTSFSFAGGTVCFVLTLWSYYLIPFLAAVMCYAFGSGLASSSINKAAMDASTYPTGIKMALYSFCMSCFGIIGSWIISYVPVGLILGTSAILGFFLNHLRTGYHHERNAHSI